MSNESFNLLFIVTCILTVFAIWNGIDIERNEQKIKELETKVESLKSKTVKREYELTVTSYTASEDETDSTPNQTSLMVEPVVGRTVAVSRDLRKFYGAKVWIEGVGIRVVEDCMNKRYSKRIDVLVATKKQARKIGISKRKVVFYDLNR